MEPTHTEHHMGIDIDTSIGYFSRPLQSFNNSPCKPVNYCNAFHEQGGGYP
jgi:hypothetical protein